ncbi:MAG: hypothetical protein JNM55_11955 [Anaerolineales bacterium]|nr:hypothetical protein [Anaerolineales bacterium]
MSWKISYLEDQKIIKTVYTEPITLEETKEAAMANALLAGEKQTGLFLADCSTFQTDANLVDIYELGKFLESLSLRMHISIKEAMIEPPNVHNVSRDLQFYENVANNRMVRVKIFQDHDAAISWLTANL